MRIRVVGRIDAQVFWPHVLFRAPRELQRVLNGWVALQRSTESQAIVEHSCDQRPLFGPGRLALHERSERDSLYRVKAAGKAGGARGIQLGPYGAKMRRH